MTKLIRYVHCFLASTALCLVTSAAVFVLRPSVWKPYVAAFLALTIINSWFLRKAGKSVKEARLIVENQILHIHTAVFQEQDNSSKKINHQPGKSIEVFISCFGILIGSKIIKYNQEDVYLKTVELGQNDIALTYGTDRITNITKILHAEIKKDELTEITRRFRYETGITPTITW